MISLKILHTFPDRCSISFVYFSTFEIPISSQWYCLTYCVGYEAYFDKIKFLYRVAQLTRAVFILLSNFLMKSDYEFVTYIWVGGWNWYFTYINYFNTITLTKETSFLIVGFAVSPNKTLNSKVENVSIFPMLYVDFCVPRYLFEWNKYF